jgi:hypothetical protein
VRVMKKRYLLLLAVIAVALVLVLPGTALAGQIQSVSWLNAGTTVDLDSGQVVQAGAAGADFTLAPTYDGGYAPWAVYCAPHCAVGQYDLYNGMYGVYTWDQLTWEAMTSYQFDYTTYYYSTMSPVAVLTSDGRFFKLQVTGTGTTGVVDLTYEQVSPRSSMYLEMPIGGTLDFETGTLVEATDPGGDVSFLAGDYNSRYWQAVNGSALADYREIWAGDETLTWDSLYGPLTWDLLSTLTFSSLGVYEGPPFVIRTAQDHYYKATWIDIDSTSAMGLIYEQLLPHDPPALLDSLADFIADPTVGTVDAVMQTSLTVKVNAALAAIDQGKDKVAVNNLKALINHVNAQSGKKISPDAAAEIIEQANAIITALGY